MATAEAEGWIARSGSKWKTIPELMLTYRAAAWMVRTNAPEIAMGLPTAEEVDDVVTLTPEQFSVEQVRAGEHAETPKYKPTGEFVPPPTETLTVTAVGAGGSGGPAIVVTFAQLADRLNAAKTTDDVDVAADLIQHVADAKQQVELRDLAKARRIALS